MKESNSHFENNFQSLLTIAAQNLCDTLRDKKLSLATAESCTGGWVAKCLTDIAGSSNWFERGFVTYSNAAKHDMLGVSEEILMEYGAVSQQTVIAMVKGALHHSRADVALAITGIAGPGGGTAEKPVGLVWFGWASRDGQRQDEKMIFPGDRDAVRQQAVIHALNGMHAMLMEYS